MAADEDIDAATAKSRAARQRLTATLVDIQQRLRPGVLLREAVEEMRDTGVDLIKSGLVKVRDNPGSVIGIGAMVAAYISRGWLMAQVRSDGAADTAASAAEASSRADTELSAPSKPKAKAKAAKPAKRKSE
ncbi:MAG: hypothetical protein ACRCSO_10240 [Sphingomonas sp.]